MKCEVIYILLASLLEVCKGQYISINTKTSKTNPCDNASNTALIEHFFNIIFTEFFNTPPACVCIQMCPLQPTYCYPNGCLRRRDRKDIDNTSFPVNIINKVQYGGTAKPLMLIGDKHKDLMDDLLEKPGLRSYIEKTDKLPSNDIFRPNPFKDLVLRYRKEPKLEIKYNLREQIKNTKIDKLNKDKLDISKTRWPLNKHLLHGKQPFHRVRHYKKNEEERQTKYFLSMFPEYGPSNYTPFYKKYLTKRENSNGVNVEALYLYQTDNGNFSLEALIDNLIESSLGKSKAKVNSSEGVDYSIHQESMMEINKNLARINVVEDEDNLSTVTMNNTPVNIVTMNSTNANVDVNKYVYDSNVSSQSFLEMIASMSKEIEKQNKANLELMERVTGKRDNPNGVIVNTGDKTIENGTTFDSFNLTESSPEITNLTTETEFSSIIDFTTRPILITRPTKKTKQRIVRKIKQKKLN